MNDAESKLTVPPDEPRARELWLQHAAGFILFQHVREYALRRIDQAASPDARAAAARAVDDALYGLMMVIDGVTGGMTTADNRRVEVSMAVRLVEPTASSHLPIELNLSEGDGMCMGIHAWREGDFGSTVVANAAAQLAVAADGAGSGLR